MREIKFRVWDGNRYITKSDIYEDENDKCLILELDGSLIDIAYDREDDYTNEYIIEQFTGLHDKNGVEIYEGDIVQECGLRETWTLSRRDEFSERKHVITWCDYDLQWCGQLIEDDEDYELDTRPLSFLERKYILEVIGNIHVEVGE